jgi:prepilin-type N-terminal cleavage/methylation domain-containing protein
MRIFSRARRRGYTVVEVLSAMSLFAIGAAGVISMQRVTIQGGDDARRMDVATNIAHEWTMRLQRDSMFWTKPNQAYPTMNNIADTNWLKNTPDSGDSGWLTPAQTDGYVGKSGDFDLFGNDRASDSGDHIFCAQYRLRYLVNPGTGSGLNPAGGLIRAEVRVFWARLDNKPIGKCEALDPAPDSADGPTFYHFVYAATAVRTNSAN